MEGLPPQLGTNSPKCPGEIFSELCGISPLEPMRARAQNSSTRIDKYVVAEANPPFKADLPGSLHPGHRTEGLLDSTNDRFRHNRTPPRPTVNSCNVPNLVVHDSQSAPECTAGSDDQLCCPERLQCRRYWLRRQFSPSFALPLRTLIGS